jgi:hypothetical protein
MSMKCAVPMRLRESWLLVVLSLLATCCLAQTSGRESTAPTNAPTRTEKSVAPKTSSRVQAEGRGDSEKAAVIDAKRALISKACGETIFSTTRSQIDTRKSMEGASDGKASKSISQEAVLSDDISAVIGGSIRSYETLEVKQESGLYRVLIIADVPDCKSVDPFLASGGGMEIVKALRGVTAELRELGRGGIVNEPKNFAEHYHNARIYAQRGEFENAKDHYERLLAFPIVMADPLADLITIARRMYGATGVKRYVEERLKHRMSTPAYLYVQLLIVDPLKPEFDTARFASDDEWLKAINDFPPIGFHLMSLFRPESFDFKQLSWADWKFFKNVNDVLSRSITNGTYLAFFVDQIRAGTQVDEYGQKGLDPAFDTLFKQALPNPEQDRMRGVPIDFDFVTYRLIDLEASPVVLDYTYFGSEPQPKYVLYGGGTYWNWLIGEWREHKDFKREESLVRLSIWDPEIDQRSPVEICSLENKEGGKEQCVNLNSSDYKCKSNNSVMGSEKYQCLSIFSDGKTNVPLNLVPMPNADSTISIKKVLGRQCISRIRYTNGAGRVMEFPASKIIATHRWDGEHEVLPSIVSSIATCGYLSQMAKSAKNHKPMMGSY